MRSLLHTPPGPVYNGKVTRASRANQKAWQDLFIQHWWAWVILRDIGGHELEYHHPDTAKFGHLTSLVAKILIYGNPDDKEFWQKNVSFLFEDLEKLAEEFSLPSSGLHPFYTLVLPSPIPESPASQLGVKHNATITTLRLNIAVDPKYDTAKIWDTEHPAAMSCLLPRLRETTIMVTRAKRKATLGERESPVELASGPECANRPHVDDTTPIAAAVEDDGKPAAKHLFSASSSGVPDVNQFVSSQAVAGNSAESSLNFGVHSQGVLTSFDHRNKTILERPAYKGNKRLIRKRLAKLATSQTASVDMTKTDAIREQPKRQVLGSFAVRRCQHPGQAMVPSQYGFEAFRDY
ncbi:hypothetical protein QQZ08_009753 [Neonectria magnoliae]|uniref:Uncharacterized protein n=1 Tax=Neonectria magnoliae TaxID=2732573 RepID=A0ABR1HKZ3_9HYPO